MPGARIIRERRNLGGDDRTFRFEDEDGNVFSESSSATGDALTMPSRTNVSLSAVYNLLPANAREYTASGGSVTVTGREFKCSTGTTTFAYGVVQSFRAIQYQIGAGATIRASARFPESVASSWSGVGAFTIGDEVSFGYNGTAFGVWHRYGGKPEVRTLTITGAAGGSENATVTINGTEYTVPITAGTVQRNAQEIAKYIAANATGWDAQQSDDTVEISAQSDGAKTNTFSFSSATATGAFAQTTAGVAKTSNHVPQADWNGATVFSTFDPTKGNNYQIRYSNGFGPIMYYIQSPTTGEYMLVHTVQWPSAYSRANFENPGLHVGLYATSIGSTTDFSVYCDHVMAFVDSLQSISRNPRATSNTKSVDTTLTNILTLRNRRNYNGLTNQAEIIPLTATLANDGAKSALFGFYGNATIGGTQNFQDIGTNLISQLDTAGTTVTGGRLLAAVTIAKGQSILISLSDLGIELPPTIEFTIAGQMASGSAADLTATITWLEDI